MIVETRKKLVKKSILSNVYKTLQELSIELDSTLQE